MKKMSMKRLFPKRANPLFLSISEGRRKQLQMNKFAGWDLDYELVMGDSLEKVG